MLLSNQAHLFFLTKAQGQEAAGGPQTGCHLTGAKQRPEQRAESEPWHSLPSGPAPCSLSPSRTWLLLGMLSQGSHWVRGEPRPANHCGQGESWSLIGHT